MLIKLTNEHGDDFLINTNYVYEAENTTENDCQTKLFNVNGNTYLVKEDLQTIHEMTISEK